MQECPEEPVVVSERWMSIKGQQLDQKNDKKPLSSVEIIEYFEEKKKKKKNWTSIYSFRQKQRIYLYIFKKECGPGKIGSYMYICEEKFSSMNVFISTE